MRVSILKLTNIFIYTSVETNHQTRIFLTACIIITIKYTSTLHKHSSYFISYVLIYRQFWDKGSTLPSIQNAMLNAEFLWFSFLAV